MRYISIDIETTGLDPVNNQILEFGAVLEDTKNVVPIEELPYFHAYIVHPNDNISGNIFALDMNHSIINKLKNRKELENDFNFVKVEDLANDFLFWLFSNNFELGVKQENTKDEYRFVKSINVAGKNFESFDKKFLDLVPDFKRIIHINRRVLDPGILFVDWKNDERIPSLGECNTRIGYNVPVNHTAIEDAKDVIRLLRTQYT